MSTELKIIGPEDLKGAALILATNKNYVEAYEKKHDKLLKQAEKEGVKLTPETDLAINNYLVSAKTCLKKMEEDRKPFTRKLDEVKELFTAEENRLKNDLYTKLQAKRDASVKAWADHQKEEDRKAQLKLDQEKERITLLADAEQQIRNAYADILQADKALMLGSFSEATAETIDEVVAILEKMEPEFTQEMFDEIVVVVTPTLISEDELVEIGNKARSGKLEKIQPHYTSELRKYADHLLTLIPTRREEIAAGQASAAALELKEKEAQALAAQQLEADRANEAKVSQQVAEAVLDSQVNQVAGRVGMPSTRKVESYSIEVTKREGWAEIFKFYLTYSDEQDLGKIKLDQMKTFAERLAKSQGLKIDSPSVVYSEKYKAIAKKAA